MNRLFCDTKPSKHTKNKKSNIVHILLLRKFLVYPTAVCHYVVWWAPEPQLPNLQMKGKKLL